MDAQNREALNVVVDELKHIAWLTDRNIPDDYVVLDRSNGHGRNRRGNARVPGLDPLLACVGAVLPLLLDGSDHKSDGTLTTADYKQALENLAQANDGLTAASQVIKNLRREGLFRRGRTQTPPHLAKVLNLRSEVQGRTKRLENQHRRSLAVYQKDVAPIKADLQAAADSYNDGVQLYTAIKRAYRRIDDLFRSGNNAVSSIIGEIKTLAGYRPESIDEVLTSLDETQRTAQNLMKRAKQKQASAQTKYARLPELARELLPAPEAATISELVYYDENRKPISEYHLASGMRENVRAVLTTMIVLKRSYVLTQFDAVLTKYMDATTKLRSLNFSDPGLPTGDVDVVNTALSNTAESVKTVYPQLAARYQQQNGNLQQAKDELQRAYNDAVGQLKRVPRNYLSEGFKVYDRYQLSDEIRKVDQITAQIDAAEAYPVAGIHRQEVLNPEERRKLYELKDLLEQTQRYIDAASSGGDSDADKFREKVKQVEMDGNYYGFNDNYVQKYAEEARELLDRCRKSSSQGTPQKPTDPRVADVLRYVRESVSSQQPDPVLVGQFEVLEARVKTAQRSTTVGF